MKRIIVTGASRGLGLTLTKKLLDSDYHVIAINRTISDGLKSLNTEYKDKLKIIEYDLLDSENIHEIIFKKEIGFDKPVHGLVNNAAMAYDDIITNLNLETLNNMFQVNVISPMMMVKSTIRHMLLHNIAGSIVNISSISVHTGYKGLAFYASTKGALEAFSKNTAREWGERFIRSNCLVAGFMETEMSSALSPEQKKRIYNRTSLKKAVSIESVSSMIEFLLSEDSESITGQSIHVDNGTI